MSAWPEPKEVDSRGLLSIRTLGELKRKGYQTKPVRIEMRDNLLRMLRARETVLPGIIGYDDTVLREIENGILAGHHMIFLGQRGQGKSRVMRLMVRLLDEYVPVVKGCEINDDPYAPVCARCRRLLAERGDELEIDWLGRDQRYSEKLATPDVSIADLIGEIDPVKVAEGRYLADEETIHYGLIPRTNRGIFAINELPDLVEKVQVGLFNLMEERDIQIKGYKIRMPLDVVFVASANPEDYTSRGRIITPLKDRFDAQIRTHYPRTLADEIAIMEQEATRLARRDVPVVVPQFIKEILAQLTFEARASSEINQMSGVSVRISINNYESVIANAERRAARLNESEIVPRISDLDAVYASTAGKLELEYGVDSGSERELIERLLNRAVLKIFDRYFKVENLRSVVQHFEQGWGVDVSDEAPAVSYLKPFQEIKGLKEAVATLKPGESPGLIAAAVEFVLEGLHQHKKLSKERLNGHLTYRA